MSEHLSAEPSLVESLPELLERHLWAARAAEHGRSAQILVHDGVLRQSIIALAGEAELHEHNAPPAASVQVLAGRIAVRTKDGEVELPSGALHRLTHERHSVHAIEDAVFLLTAVTSIPEELREG